MALLGSDTFVTGPLPDGALLLETLQGKEALGTPFAYNLTLLSEDPSIAAEAVLGHPLTIQIKLDNGNSRYFHGVVTYFAKTGFSVRHTRYAAVLNPTLTLFDYTRDCRIYFDAKAQKLAKEVLTHPRHSVNVEGGGLDGSYRTREYCVQYRESYFNFIHRLLEEEGIYYYFKHAKDKHTMVLADSATAHAKVPGYETVALHAREHTQQQEEEHFWSLTVAGSLYPGKLTTLQGYDYRQPRPRSAQLQIKPSSAGQPGTDFDDYDNPGGLTESTEAEADAAVRLGTDLVANTLIEVEGNTMGLGVGDLVTVVKSPNLGAYMPFWKDGDFGKDYLITSATFSLSINQHETGEVAASDEPFHASFTLLDSQTPFRPQRRAHRPRIEGPQTAVVVGPSTEEIYTDKLGRVKVQFDWDRLGQSDQQSSCWVRVAQVWAGKQWGAIHTPRIGQEVIVEFLDGDPDRPIITGRVYNADSMPPYTLPDNKTQSGIKSRSSKNGTPTNFNEIRFEDFKDKEHIFVQAEKDMTVLVKNDETVTVIGNRTETVGTGPAHKNETITIHGNRTETVDDDETITIHGNRTETVDKDETVTIHGKRIDTVDKDETIKIHGNRKDTVKLDETVNIHGNRKDTVDLDETVTITGARKVTITKHDALIVDDGRDVTIKGDDKTGASKKLALNGGEEISIKSGDASITLTKDGTITLQGKDVVIKAKQINAKADGDIVIKGSKVSHN